MTTNRIIKGVVAATAVWLGGGLLVGEAQATIPDANWVYTGCYHKSARTIRVIDAEGGETCKPNENLITWNKVGQPGQDAPKADGPCFNDNTNRYQDCGNGTVTDTVTGLIWLKQADCVVFYEGDNTGVNPRDWAAANQAAAALATGSCGLDDKSSPGDWRLPTYDEWYATLNFASAVLNCIINNSPTLTNTAGTACYKAGPQSFPGVPSTYYWSSVTISHYPDNAYIGNLYDGFTESAPFYDYKGFDHAVWPVRGGQ